MKKIMFLALLLGLVMMLGLYAADFKDVLGTRTPWPCAAVTGEDGNVYLLATDKRPDGTCTEAVVFQLSGY